MSKFRFNQLFALLMALGLLGSLIIPPDVTNRAKGKEEVILYPVSTPVRAIAGIFHRKYGRKELPPGETTIRKDPELATENAELRQQVVFLNQQLEDLRLVENERKHLGKLLDYFKPVTVLGGDATPDRESLAFMPTSGIETAPGTAVMGAEGLVGRMVEGRRVRLITDKGFTITGKFGRWEKSQWRLLPNPKPSVRGIGNNTMRVDNLSVKEAEGLKPEDWVVVSDTDYPAIIQERQIGQIESIRPIPGKPLFAEIIVKPRKDLRTLPEILVPRTASVKQ